MMLFDVSGARDIQESDYFFMKKCKNNFCAPVLISRFNKSDLLVTQVDMTIELIVVAVECILTKTHCCSISKYLATAPLICRL
jgi:hypothetical protein